MGPERPGGSSARQKRFPVTSSRLEGRAPARLEITDGNRQDNQRSPRLRGRPHAANDAQTTRYDAPSAITTPHLTRFLARDSVSSANVNQGDTTSDCSTQWIGRVSEELLPLVYEDLRTLARIKLANEPADHTLQPTALVHECYLRLTRNSNVQWQGRGHFFAAAGEAMRRLLVERARRNNCLKRGRNHARIALDEAEIAASIPCDQIEAVSEAVTRLESAHPRIGAVVKLRFFVGMKKPEIAEAIGVSQRTVDTDWAFARAWLYRELDRDIE